MNMGSRIAIASGSNEYTFPLQLGGGNAIQAQVVVYNLGTATSLTVALEGSVDGQTWTNVASYTLLALGANFPTKTTGIAFPLIRCKATPVAGGPVICSIDLNPSHQ